MDIDKIVGHRNHTENFKKHQPDKVFKCSQCTIVIWNNFFYMVTETSSHVCDSGEYIDYFTDSNNYEHYDVIYCNKCYNNYRQAVIKEFNRVMSND